MTRIRKNILTLAAIAVCGLCTAPQAVAQTVLDGAYIKEHTKTKRVVPYTHIREADVMWARRVWRTIDLREKMNHPLYFPMDPINDRKSLFDVIRQGLLWTVRSPPTMLVPCWTMMSSRSRLLAT